jgi:predicted Zn-dependent protease
VAPHELHALDYAVYGYLQRGQDSAARATVAMVRGLRPTEWRALIYAYNSTAMEARIPLERGDWQQAAALTPPVDSASPVAAALIRFTRAIGAARSGDAGAARVELAALDSLAGVLESSQDPYWSRVVRIKRDAAGAWARLAAGDTAAALALAHEAAETEEVTDKHPVTPAELLPARELEGDMLLLTGRHDEARKAYQATLAREPGRARSIFGAARAAERSGDRDGAAAGYAEFLGLMANARPGRPEIATAKAFATHSP